MLSRELMGGLCLAILWLNALLVAGAALQDLREVLGLRRRAKRALRGTIESGEGPGGVFAEWWLEQRGRALDAKSAAIAFHDRAFHSSITGGGILIGERSVRVSGPGEVWVSLEARAAAAACRDAGTFEAAYAQATQASGFQREVRVPLRAGDQVWLLGELAGDAVVSAGRPLVVCGFDPRGQLSRHAATLAAFIPAELAACALASWVALSTPHFGPRSIFGAILCLGFFLGVTPLAVALSERVRRPSEAYLRGSWTRPTSEARDGVAAEQPEATAPAHA